MAEFDGGLDRDNGTMKLAHPTKFGAIASPPSIFVPTLEIRPNGSPAINEKRFLSNYNFLNLLSHRFLEKRTNLFKSNCSREAETAFYGAVTLWKNRAYIPPSTPVVWAPIIMWVPAGKNREVGKMGVKCAPLVPNSA